MEYLNTVYAEMSFSRWIEGKFGLKVNKQVYLFIIITIFIFQSCVMMYKSCFIAYADIVKW